MIAPELQNYIRQSRTSGMTDEQIRQNLASQGWTEADISQALGSNSAASATSVVASVGVTGWLTGKVITIIIAALLILGGGAYFALSKKGSPPQQEISDNTLPQNNQPTNTTNGTGSGNSQSKPSTLSQYRCEGLLPESEYIRIFGKAPFVFKGRWVEEQLPDQRFSDLNCNYYPGDSGRILRTIGIHSDNKWSFDIAKDVASKASDGNIKEIPGLGSDAFYTTDLLFKDISNHVEFLSTDQNYIITVVGSRTRSANQATKDQELANIIEVARVVSNNFDK